MDDDALNRKSNMVKAEGDRDEDPRDQEQMNERRPDDAASGARDDDKRKSTPTLRTEM